MDFRKLILLCMLACMLRPLAAQITYQQADAQTYNCYLEGRWKALDSVGRLALKAGIDYPYLRMRMGYAAFMRGNYDRSLTQYAAALKQNPVNQGAIEMSALDNIYLGRTEAAEYFFGRMDDSIRKNYALHRFDAVNSIDVEGGSAFPNDDKRGNSTSFRAGIRTRIGWRWSLYQSYGFFKQTVIGDPPVPGLPQPTIDVKQNDYLARMKYQLLKNLNVMLGYHYYGYTTAPERTPPPGAPPVGQVNFKGNIGLAGVNITLPRVAISANAALARQDSSTFQQYCFGATYLPFGNLNITATAMGYLQVSPNRTRFVPSPAIGIHPQKRIWAEASYTFNNFNNLYENEGVYVVNMYDDTKHRLAVGVHVLLGSHLFLNLAYLQESKFYQQEASNVTYQQPTITGGLLWKH